MLIQNISRNIFPEPGGMHYGEADKENVLKTGITASADVKCLEPDRKSCYHVKQKVKSQFEKMEKALQFKAFEDRSEKYPK